MQLSPITPQQGQQIDFARGFSAMTLANVPSYDAGLQMWLALHKVRDGLIELLRVVE